MKVELCKKCPHLVEDKKSAYCDRYKTFVNKIPACVLHVK